MEFVIVLLLIYLIFKDDIRDEINYHREKRHPEVKNKEQAEMEKRKEEMEAELRNMMDYSLNTAINSKKR